MPTPYQELLRAVTEFRIKLAFTCGKISVHEFEEMFAVARMGRVNLG